MSITDPLTATPTTAVVHRFRPLAIVFTLGALADRWLVELTSWLAGAPRRLHRRLRDDRGQATTEYALVLLAAALVALLVIAWATAGGGAARISRLFNRVIDAVIDRV